MASLPPAPEDNCDNGQFRSTPVQSTDGEASAAERRAALIQKTLELWQPRTSRQLTEEDAQQMIDNAVGVFRLLLKWRQEELLTEKSVDTYKKVSQTNKSEGV